MVERVHYSTIHTRFTSYKCKFSIKTQIHAINDKINKKKTNQRSDMENLHIYEVKRVYITE